MTTFERMRLVSIQRLTAGQRVEAAGSALSVVAGLVFYAIFIARSRSDVGGKQTFTLFEDAMVSMRYADNLAHGHGLAWNLHGPAVEGYTNLLWTLWMSFLHWLGLAGSSAALSLMVTGAVLLVLTALCAGAVARRLSSVHGVGIFATLATAFSFPLVYWTLRGMEVGVLAFLVTASILLCLRIDERPNARDISLLGVAVVAMTLTRTDALLFGLVFAGWLALRSDRRRAAAIVVALTVATFAAHTALRLALYGEALPNTYYLKLYRIPLADRLDRGFHTLGAAILDNLWLSGVLAGTALVFPRERLRRLSLPAATVLAALVYSLWVGGDAWDSLRFANRYVSVVLPALFTLSACGVARILELGWRTRSAFVGVVATCAMVAVLAHHGPAAAGIAAGAGLIIALLRPVPVLIAASLIAAVVGLADWRAFNSWRRDNAAYSYSDAFSSGVGAAVRRITPTDTTIAVVAAGSIPYHAHRQTVDLLGKNDAHIARLKPKGPFRPGHDKWDYDYSIGVLRPDLVLQHWFDPPSPAQFKRWGYVKQSWFYVLQGGKVDLKTARQLERAVAELTRPANRRTR